MKHTATKQWWIVGAVILTAAGIASICNYQVLKPFTPFDFLRGVAPVADRIGARARELHHPYINGIRYTEFHAVYALPSDFATIRARAEPEILAKGFKLVKDDKSIGTQYSRTIDPKQGGDPIEESVSITKNFRYRTGKPEEGYSIWFEHQKGWTSVEVMLFTSQSPIETFLRRCWDWITSPTGPQLPFHVPH